MIKNIALIFGERTSRAFILHALNNYVLISPLAFLHSPADYLFKKGLLSPNFFLSFNS